MDNMEALERKLNEAETAEEVIRICADAGYEITEKQLKNLVAEGDEELNEADLEYISGGASKTLALAKAAMIGIRTIVRKNKNSLIK